MLNIGWLETKEVVDLDIKIRLPFLKNRYSSEELHELVFIKVQALNWNFVKPISAVNTKYV